MGMPGEPVALQLSDTVKLSQVKSSADDPSAAAALASQSPEEQAAAL